MLMSLILLLAIATACALTLGRGAPEAPQAHVPQPRAVADDERAEAWRAMALEVNADAKALRLAIVEALDSTDPHNRSAVLRSALAQTRGRVPVRVTL